MLNEMKSASGGELEEHKINWLRLGITVLIVLITAAAVGGGVWYAMDQNAKKQKEANEAEIALMQKQIDALKDKESTKTVTTTKDETADWKTYTNADYNFILKYPNDWNGTNITGGINISKGNNKFEVIAFNNPGGLSNEAWLQQEIKNNNIGEAVLNKSTKNLGSYNVLYFKDEGMISRNVFFVNNGSKIIQVSNVTVGFDLAVIESVIKTIKFNQ